MFTLSEKTANDVVRGAVVAAGVGLFTASAGIGGAVVAAYALYKLVKQYFATKETATLDFVAAGSVVGGAVLVNLGALAQYLGSLV